eukprot:5930108-Amphidinium_carterae.5
MERLQEDMSIVLVLNEPVNRTRSVIGGLAFCFARKKDTEKEFQNRREKNAKEFITSASACIAAFAPCPP